MLYTFYAVHQPTGQGVVHLSTCHGKLGHALYETWSVVMKPLIPIFLFLPFGAQADESLWQFSLGIDQTQERFETENQSNQLTLNTPNLQVQWIKNNWAVSYGYWQGETATAKIAPLLQRHISYGTELSGWSLALDYQWEAAWVSLSSQSNQQSRYTYYSSPDVQALTDTDSTDQRNTLAAGYGLWFQATQLTADIALSHQQFEERYQLLYRSTALTSPVTRDQEDDVRENGWLGSLRLGVQYFMPLSEFSDWMFGASIQFQDTISGEARVQQNVQYRTAGTQLLNDSNEYFTRSDTSATSTAIQTGWMGLQGSMTLGINKWQDQSWSDAQLQMLVSTQF